MKTIAITEDVWKDIQKVKIELDCYNMNDLIKLLIIRSRMHIHKK